MKKSILILAAVLFGFNSSNAQFWKDESVKGNGKVTTENRNTGDYDEVKLTGFMDVELTAGTEGRLIIEGESNLLEHVITEVENGSLKIYTEKGYSLKPSKGKGIKITVPFKDLNAVSLTGSGDIWNTSVIRAQDFETSLTGSGDINLHLEVKNLKGLITGSGDTLVKGKAENFEISVTGSGDFKAFNLEAKDVKAKIMGSGDIELTALNSLEAKVMGSGDITYDGKPKKEDLRAMGSGSISSR